MSSKINEIEFALEEMKRIGVSTVTCADGTVFMFDRSFLEKILLEDKTKDQILIKIQNRQFKD